MKVKIIGIFLVNMLLISGLGAGIDTNVENPDISLTSFANDEEFLIGKPVDSVAKVPGYIETYDNNGQKIHTCTYGRQVLYFTFPIYWEHLTCGYFSNHGMQDSERIIISYSWENTIFKTGRIYPYRIKGVSARPDSLIRIPWRPFDQLACGDVDGDDIDELIHVIDANNFLYIYKKFSHPILILLPIIHYLLSYYSLKKISLGIFEKGDELACGDVDGDGKDEICIARTNGQLEIYKINGYYTGFDVSFEENDDLACGDVDGDGEDEILIADVNEAEVRIYNQENQIEYSWPVNLDEYGGFDCGYVFGSINEQFIVARYSDSHVLVFNGMTGDVIKAFPVDYKEGYLFSVGDVIRP